LVSTIVWDVVGVGVNSVDSVLLLPEHLPPLAASAKVRLRAQTFRCGGQTATTLATCASLGLTTMYAGVVGRDEDARRVREALARRGVNLSHLIERDAATQTATVLVHLDTGSRVVLSTRDPRLSMRGDEVPIEALGAARVVHVDDVDINAAIEAAKAARAADVPVTSDLDQVSDRTEELLDLVTHPIFSEETPHLLTGIPDTEEALRDLRRRHSGVLCVTLGEHGAVALEGDRLHRHPGFPVAARDTTGAGDVFRGAFIYGLLRGWAVPGMLEFAAAAAAVSCTRIGAIDGVPMLDDIEPLLSSTGQRVASGRQLETPTRAR
jgi:sugar/nucleoside kinase (ribokinase family)